MLVYVHTCTLFYPLFDFWVHVGYTEVENVYTLFKRYGGYGKGKVNELV